MHLYVIGCGGTGSWLIKSLACLTRKPLTRLTLIDGDRVEKKNFDRQSFNPSDLGRFKTQALRDVLVNSYPGLPVETIDDYLTEDSLVPEPQSTLFVCVDNHPARLASLRIADMYDATCFIAGNEYYEAEAYMYRAEWQNTPLDPRIFYPRISEDTVGDPLRPPCTGEEAEANPQLITANYVAAGFLLQLFTFWTVQIPGTKMGPETSNYWPVHYQIASGKHLTWRIGDRIDHYNSTQPSEAVPHEEALAV